MTLPYGRQSIDEDDVRMVLDALRGDYLTTGPYIEQFEDRLCEVTGASYAVACVNGTAALHLASMAAGLKRGVAAIVPSITFLATANAVRYCGADVIFCDVDAETGLMTPSGFQEALARAEKNGQRVLAVFPVHLTGRTVDIKAIKALADTKSISVIADACHAIGGTYKQKPIGACAFEDFSVFSFHPVKTVTTGEGGAITTNDKSLAEKMRQMRNHGMVKTNDMALWEYEMRALGYNYRITDVQCALGLSQLKKLSGFIKKRLQLVAFYNQLLEGLSPAISIPKKYEGANIGWHLYAVRIDFDQLGISRQDMMQELRDRGIGTQVHYIPLYRQPYYQDLYGALSFPGAEAYYANTLSLPLYPMMDEGDVKHVVEAIKQIIFGE